MDLVSTIRKSGSRGGVNFSWDEVSTSAHRENYLGHSLKAPVGRWQKGRDLNWYAKGDDSAEGGADDETAEQKRERERKEEIRRVKEAEEDALNRALGLPVPDRNQSGGVSSGANNVGLGEVRRIVGEVGVDEGEAKGFGEYVGKIEKGDGGRDMVLGQEVGEGGLAGGKGRRRDEKETQRGRRERLMERERGREERGSGRRARERERSPGSHRRRRDHRERSRSRSPRRGERDRGRRERSRSPDAGHTRRRDERERSREHHERRRRSRSGDRNERRYRERSPHGDFKRSRQRSWERRVKDGRSHD